MKKYYNNYLALFDNENYNNESYFEIYNTITLMKKGFEADYWIAPVLRYYEKYKFEELVRFLKLIDRKFSADWISSLSPTQRIENVNLIIKEIEDTKDKTSLFSSKVFDFSKDDLVRVLSGNIYGKNFAKYILLKIDLSYLGEKNKFNPPPTISIEHILPQNPNDSSKWKTDFTDLDRDKWTHKLGNLILLSRTKNISQSNYDYDVKRDKYFKGNVELFSNSIRIWKEYQTWKLSDLQKNHKEMLIRTLAFYDIQLTDDQLNEALK